MAKPTLCLIHEGIGPYNAIAKIAMGQVRSALESGWRVTVVAKLLDESLRQEVEWLKLYVPPRLLLAQWMTARHFIQQALGGRQFDVVHAHQPQVAALADVFQCHFLTRAAHERGCLEKRGGFRPGLLRLQEQGVLHAEDRYYKGWNPATRMVFCSELLRNEFGRHYGLPPRQEVLTNAAPSYNPVNPQERLEAQLSIMGREPGQIVIGYLGGLQERKGYRRLLDAVAREEDLLLLMGGSYTDGFSHARLGDRLVSVGLVTNLRQFYAACDVVVVPSYFDPCPLVVFEAVAAGLPVVATDGVGNLATLLQYGAGACWQPQNRLGPLVRELMQQRDSVRRGAERLTSALSESRQNERILRIYDEVRGAGVQSTSPRGSAAGSFVNQ